MSESFRVNVVCGGIFALATNATSLDEVVMEGDK